MKTINHIEVLKKEIKTLKLSNKSIGLIPTMGYLHEGHLSLINSAKEECDIIAVSIFVNPTQFGENEDFSIYPRDLKRDIGLCIKHKVDILFIPSASEMYPPDFKTYVEVNKLSYILCGKSRPEHFKGVTTIVAKLFNLFKPDKAYFGLKDYQQYIIIKNMTRDLNFPIDIIGCPIIRESNGLAMSSRNIYLSEEEYNKASLIYASLREAKRMIKNGEKNPENIIKMIEKMLKNIPNSKIDYIKICNPETLEEVASIEKDVIILIACFVGKARLIDNMLIKV